MDTFLFIIELLGTVAFAASGALTGIEKRMDIFGVAILGVVTAVGGGVIRDLVIGITPPKAFQDPVYLIVALVVSVALFFPAVRRPLARSQKLFDTTLLLMDAAGLGIFTVTGITTAIGQANCRSVLLLFFVGMLTGTGGGVLRDILAGDMPYIFRKHIYASASLAGAGVFLLCRLILPQSIAALIGIAVVMIIRFAAAHFEWNLPRAQSVWKSE
ncbi:MAG: trimeric intracellular cation channel family protein [Clostridiales bacterium]|nr:trimeric intracellular cation channel family protein [Clostridiales bacterium]MDD6935536.1 trimeric intracellular cation channel family protein [Clostridiales bacterium]MDY2961568.1 trimeric intracellular cation channel family protein [Oscillospiraceae bacterium]